MIAPELPDTVIQVLDGFIDAARAAFGDGLRAAVLYGSGAEGRLRATSDVNLMLVLGVFGRAQADAMREPMRVAEAAIQLKAMFLLEDELNAAVAAFPEKFADVLRRRRVLHGADPFAHTAIPRAAAVARLRQVLLNETLRLRNVYVMRGLREEQLALAVADAAGPLRSCAASLLELEGQPAGSPPVLSPMISPRDALRRVAQAFPEQDWGEMLDRMGGARDAGYLPPGVAADTLFRLIELARRMHERADALSSARPETPAP